ncbi:MAG: hypothetical protein ATN35_07775 [Epulopiscium sp. Nele67-Bin004]|nr:MAG: hypothetical protein ATN35_07775 [Epulopiscium sp. Nele67-Bin004]
MKFFQSKGGYVETRNKICLLENLDVAIKNSRNFSTDIDELESNLGTNLAELINELRSNNLGGENNGES